MGSFEQKVNIVLQRFPNLKKRIKRIYQLGMYTISPKLKNEGNIKRITPIDNKEYFFGYYDKSPWDATDRYMLCIRVNNSYKKPDNDDEAELVLIDTLDNSISVFGTTHSWNVQQGCMLQWLGPDFKTRVIYNDFINNSYCSVIYNIKTKEQKILQMPIYSVSNDGSFALTLDFSRLHRMRPGYGYSNIPDNTVNELCPSKPCIWKINLYTGAIVPILMYSDFIGFETRPEMENAEHKVNHIMISPSGKRFMVLHRWFVGQRKYTRLVTANCDGKDMYNLLDSNFVSHCYWKNDEEILSFAEIVGNGRGYFLLSDKSNKFEHKWDNLTMDGHPSYSVDGKIITDTYPDRKRISRVYMLDEDKNKTIEIAKVFAPFKYDNEVRCDLHPRWNRNGTKVCIDSAFEGKREMYVISMKEREIKPIVCLRRCVNKGPVQQTYNILKNISQTGENIAFMTIKNEDSVDSIYDKFKKLDMDRYFCNMTAKQILKTIVMGKGLFLEEIKKANPTVIHTTGIVVDIVGYRAAKVLDIKQVSTIRNYVYDDYPKKFGRLRGNIIAYIHMFMMRHLTNRCEYICCSKSLADKYLKKNNIDMKYIRNGVDTERFNPCNMLSKICYREKYNIPNDAIVYITVAQVIERKNISETIEAIPDFIDNKEVLFILVGEGNQLNLLEEKYGGRNNIMFVGKQEKVENWLMLADVFVSSSESEGLPNSVIEAMAMGLPIVLSDIPQHKEIFEMNNEIGELYKLHDIEDLKEKLIKVLQNAENRGIQGKILAGYELSAKRMSDEYYELYRSK